MKRKQEPPQNPGHASKEKRIWFAIKDGGLFRPDLVRDIAHLYSPDTARRLPYGAFVCFRRLPEEADLTLENVATLIRHAHAGRGMLVPTPLLGDGWDIPPREPIDSSHLRAIMLGIADWLRFPTGLSGRPQEFAGTAQPLLALETGAGTCFERVSILAAVFRRNSIPARIIGSFDFIPLDRPNHRHHWWVEAEVGGRWERFDMTLHPSLSGRLPVLPRDAVSLKNLDFYRKIAEALEILRSRGLPAYATDDEAVKAAVESATVAPEMDLPRHYPRDQRTGPMR